MRQLFYLGAMGVLLHLFSCTQAPGTCKSDEDCTGGRLCQEEKCECPAGQTLCGVTCVSLLENNKHCGTCDVACEEGRRCQQGVCQCPKGQLDCAGTCVQVQSDDKNCGACGKVCQSGEVCAEGRCRDSCPPSTPTSCKGGCVNTQSDANHCGACDKACKEGQICQEGKCLCSSERLACGEDCVDPLSDPKHCGACNAACKKNQVCASGQCVTTCPKSTPTLCFGRCIDTGNDPAHCGKCGNACSAGKICQGGTCRCPQGESECNGRCVNTQTSHAHCGACGNDCKSKPLCAGGTCVLECPSKTQTACFGGCVETETDPDHCGGCGQACRGGKQCVKGACLCPKGTLDCRGNCIDPQSHILHCGGCNKACAAGEVCFQGKCQASCPKSTPDSCYRSCVNIQSNADHCGGCGQACKAGEACKAGKCVCPSGHQRCRGQCVDLQKSQQHCGKCDNACPVGKICSKGSCQVECPRGQVLCDGRCVILQTDNQHCGACNKACKGRKRCVDGACRCPQSFQDCNGVCVDVQGDANHCGKCDIACKAGEKCLQGKCKLECPTAQKICGNQCVDPQSDARHCGDCNKACGTGQHCEKGVCTCPAGQDFCNKQCVDTQLSPAHCGKCDKACAQGETCISGACRLCPSSALQCGTSCCPKKLSCCNKACTDIQNNANHCGACGKACQSGEICCGGSCINLQSDDKNCGACGRACLQGDRCCGGRCVNVQQDRFHCGQCNQPCHSGELCKSGKCELTCPAGQSKCAGQCLAPNIACTAGRGACQNSGTLRCKADGSGPECSATPLSPKSESCDGLDNNCDGKIDELFPSKGQDCTAGKGLCAKQGKLVCNANGSGLVCDAQPGTPSVEVCDGKDNNCDGQVDESFGTKGNSCTVGKGLCASTGKFVCKADGSDVVCDAQAGTPAKEACDGKDNDCDGKTDEDCNWASNIWGSGDLDAAGIVVDSKGGALIAGTFGPGSMGEGQSDGGLSPSPKATVTFGKITLAGAGGDDVFVARTDTDGTFLWARVLGGSSRERASAIARDSADNVYVGGEFNGTLTVGTQTLTPKGSDDLFVIKLDSKGQPVWATALGGTSTDKLNSLTVDSAGNIYATGYFYSTFVAGTAQATSLGSSDVFVVKLSPAGAVVWLKSFGSTSYDRGADLAVDSSGQVYVTGLYRYTLLDKQTTLATSKGGYDVFVVKLSSSGKILWTASGGGTPSERVQAIALDKSGKAYIAGHFYGSGNNSATFGNTTLKSQSYSDVFLAQVSTTGAFGWAKALGGSSGRYAEDLTSDSSGNLYLYGEFSGSLTLGSTTLTSVGRDDLFLTKLDGTGKFLWAKKAGGADDEMANRIAVDSAGFPYSYGGFRNSATFGSVSLVSRRFFDLFVAKLRP